MSEDGMLFIIAKREISACVCLRVCMRVQWERKFFVPGATNNS